MHLQPDKLPATKRSMHGSRTRATKFEMVDISAGDAAALEQGSMLMESDVCK
jgi:hypothetical protein